ncbi:hypothetical protein LAZ67_4001161 [Cordylochernes scorpioides]|uniref:RNA-directed DNA polymerase n=1 Tax=Cordylochernes scorpioides TaxID=51811 RepID=A0ABY6KBW3_9ARAC|nr:hypothetical protein LAZ67_4001161 [Cordylochernes scorpioides]
MTRLIAAQYYWDGMTNDIRTHVRTCSVCQLVKPPKGPIYGELGQLPPAVLPYELVSLDTISGFAKYGNSQTFLHVVVDHATRYAWAFPSRSTSILTYTQVIKKVMQFGSPKRLLTDRAPAFTSPKFRRFLIRHNIGQLLTTSNNPQANGLSERLNVTITGKLKLLRLQQPKTAWTKLLPQVLQAYNHTPHSKRERAKMEEQIDHFNDTTEQSTPNKKRHWRNKPAIPTKRQSNLSPQQETIFTEETPPQRTSAYPLTDRQRREQADRANDSPDISTRHGNRAAMWPKPCDKFSTFDLTSSRQCSRQQATNNFPEVTSFYKIYMERLPRQQDDHQRLSLLTELSSKFRCGLNVRVGSGVNVLHQRTRHDRSVHPDHNTGQLRCLVRMDVLFWIDACHTKGCRMAGQLYMWSGMLQKAFKDDCISRSQSGKWHKAFKEGREEVADEPFRTPNNGQN